MTLDPAFYLVLAASAGAGWALARRRPGGRLVAFVGLGVGLNLATIGYLALLPAAGEAHSFAFLIGALMTLPALVVLGLSWANSPERARRPGPFFGVVATVAAPFATFLTGWPLLVAFWASSPALNRLADRVEAGGAVVPGERAGLYRILEAEVDPDIAPDGIRRGVLLILRTVPGDRSGLLRLRARGRPPGERETYLGGRWEIFATWGR